MTIDKNRVMIARKRLGRHDQQEVALLCDIVEGWGANLNADKRKVLDQLRARTRIFESRNGEGIPSVTQRE